MREIKYHNGETIKVDGIHFYGCSFVAGQELMDKEIPDPMGLDLHKMAKQIDEPLEEFYRRKLSRELLFKKKIKLEKQLAWPQHFCEALKVRCYNHGSHGSSMTEIKGTLLQHIVEELHNPKQEAIFVGITGFAREMVFASDEHIYKTGLPRSLVVAHDFERRGDLDFARKYLVLKDEYTHLWQFLHEIYNIINICKENDLKLYILPMLDPFDIDWYEKQYKIDFEIPHWTEQIKYLESKIDKYHNWLATIIGEYIKNDRLIELDTIDYELKER